MKFFFFFPILFLWFAERDGVGQQVQWDAATSVIPVPFGILEVINYAFITHI
jgi:hypothetical protein